MSSADGRLVNLAERGGVSGHTALGHDAGAAAKGALRSSWQVRLKIQRLFGLWPNGGGRRQLFKA